MEFRADLHCHTTCSDGSLTPEELIFHAKEKGISGLAITDHDTLDAYETAWDAAFKAGVSLISGVEFSCSLEENPIHILGYSFSLHNLRIQAFCEAHRERRQQRNLAILHKLNNAGMPLTESDVHEMAGGKSIGRPHIALALKKKGYIKSIDEAFHKFIGEGKPCYIKGETFSVQETVDIIKEAKGLAVIAHPHLVKNKNILHALLEMDFDGLEGRYALFDEKENQKWVSIAKKKKWLITGGSDFHGQVKPRLPLGASWVDEATFCHLKEHFLGNQ